MIVLSSSNPTNPQKDIAETLNVSVPTLYRGLPAANRQNPCNEYVDTFVSVG